MTIARAVAQKTRKGRTATVQPSTNFVYPDKFSDSTITLRLQRLGVLGIVGAHARLLAPLAWGEAS